MTTTNAEPSEETTAAASEQFVTFSVCGELFGIPLAEVREVIRVPHLNHVPLAAKSLEGIANLRGTVLPVTSLRHIFKAAPAPHDDATRVVVINRGSLMGFVVDRMAGVIGVERDQIESVNGIRATGQAQFLSGVIKRGDGMVLLLDLDLLIEHGLRSDKESGSSRAMPEAGSGSEPRPMPRVEAAVPARAPDDIRLVSFEVAGEEYAFPIEEVLEIIQMPERVNSVPRAAECVAGFMTLRDRLLPLVSLRQMFKLPPAPKDGPSRIVVVSPNGDQGRGGWVGVVMDSVNEVLHVRRDCVHQVPPLLAESRSELTSICRLDKGKRLVSILSAPRMFESPEMRKLIGIGEDQKHEAAVEESEEKFVIFRLGGEEYGVPIAAVQEIVCVPEDFTALPMAPGFIEGVVNLRGMVLPVVDQRRRFNLPDVARTNRQRIVVLASGATRAGFVVDHVNEVLGIKASEVEPAPPLSPQQMRVIRRIANPRGSRRMIFLLEPAHMLDKEAMKPVATAA